MRTKKRPGPGKAEVPLNTEPAKRSPRILVVTPEITYLPAGMGNMANCLRAKAGGLADVSAALVSALFELGADVHVALPHYRRMVNVDVQRLIRDELRVFKNVLPNSRIHLAQDRIFYYRDQVYGQYHEEGLKIALAFQREVINNIIPKVNPDLIHCNDWMTGLIPAIGRRLGIPCLLTIHNIHTREVTLEQIEETGIDAAEFWQHLYYTRFPSSYEATRSSAPVDMLASGIFAAHFINTVSPTFLEEVVDGRHGGFVPEHLRWEVVNKKNAGCAVGILNAPGPVFDPQTDRFLEKRYTPESRVAAKQANKLRLQDKLGLLRDRNAPLFYWPSRLDPLQKGCQLLAEILQSMVNAHWKEHLQVALIAHGEFQRHFRDIARAHNLQKRIAVCDFDEGLSHLAYAGSDFLLMPSLYEPCGLPQMIGAIYGSLPIVHDTGGLHDTVSPLNVDAGTGNGFVFRHHDANGLRWAMEQALAFHRLPGRTKDREIARIMNESTTRFTHPVTARQYIDLYEKMLERPLVEPF
ncbi:MAG: glycogen/starch synthase [Verrucomicrobiota bacterium]|nr:glycogen/starch synthase [Verrucomicrobiota bacterium]